jgi:hypothetical protein
MTLQVFESYFTFLELDGVDGLRETPVPISNTVVKTYSADGTWAACPGRVGDSIFLL